MISCMALRFCWKYIAVTCSFGVASSFFYCNTRVLDDMSSNQLLVCEKLKKPINA